MLRGVLNGRQTALEAVTQVRRHQQHDSQTDDAVYLPAAAGVIRSIAI